MHEVLIDDENNEEEEKSIKQSSSSITNNDDLRELCILLDEERNKMHELAEQWKIFGMSTIHKLECQIVDYQEKLRELEQRQNLLLKENETLKSFISQMMKKEKGNENTTKDKKIQANIVSTQANIDKQETSHSLCFHRPKSINRHSSQTKMSVPPRPSLNETSCQISIDDPLQQQISIQNMFDAIKTAEVYESIEDIGGDNDESEKKLLKEFCNLIWKYLEDRSKPKSSCLV